MPIHLDQILQISSDVFMHTSELEMLQELMADFFIAATLISELDPQKDWDVIHKITKAEIMLSVFHSLPRDK